MFEELRRGNRWFAGIVAAAFLLTACGVPNTFHAEQQEVGSASNAVPAV
jgi:hypothetical protein